MPTENLEVSTEHIALVQAKYEESANALTPTSRTILAKHLSEKTQLPYKTALQVVDMYCEQNNVPVPDYLSHDFNIGWLKVVSVALMCVAVGACFYGRTLHLRNETPTPAWVVAAVFGGLSVFVWVRSLEEDAGFFKKK
jgi:DMSO reductase anchor subunit